MTHGTGERINKVLPVLNHLKMQMRKFGKPRHAHLGQGLSPCDPVADTHLNATPTQMAVCCLGPVIVVQNNNIAASTIRYSASTEETEIGIRHSVADDRDRSRCSSDNIDAVFHERIVEGSEVRSPVFAVCE